LDTHKKSRKTDEPLIHKMDRTVQDPIFSIAEPAMRDPHFRARMTCSCRDSDYIPKVANAGAVLTKNGQRIQIMHNGVKVIAGGYGGDWMAGIITELRGHHEPQEEAIFHEILKLLPQGASMIELGGNWSYYSIWFLKNFKARRRSVVLEPDPANLATGQANATLNKSAIEFVNASIGAVAAQTVSFRCESGETISIPQTTVPGLLERFDIPVLDILHCDIQGVETEVLSSCRPLFVGHKIRFCVVSTHSHHISADPLTHQRCLAILQDAGGQILAEHDVHESFSGDGLIVAYFGTEAIKWVPPRISYNRYSASLFRNPLFDLDEINRKAFAVERSLPVSRPSRVRRLLERFRVT
jgi:FkbM family methyltransferase